MDNYYAWSEGNRQHLSVGAVILNSEKKILVHKLARIGNKYFLPKKTHSNGTALEQTLHSTEAETGYKVYIEKYLGSRQSTFPDNTGKDVNKTTLYFLCSVVEQTQRDPQDRDADSELVWMDKDELVKVMQEQGSTENDLDESLILDYI